ncbi:hypothetical protein [Agitococcus lubricus]|uniref:Uncharacterized protein n=1 Tax=Agitococcus lubricus TaxID=1077255 RepID=A0A2T5J2W0_9GAMM|nr:hypothetical protein [Agitococcus lubricus]PTQ90951.1 hypothetical protein C8N29_10120 [Agitococcus lubricus]
MDWSQLLQYAAKAANLVKQAVDTLAEEHDIFLPESVLNTALSALASRSQHLHALSFQLHDDWFEVDLVFVYQQIEFGINASFDVEDITFDAHKQSVILRERRPIYVETRRFASSWQKLSFSLWAWWCQHIKKTTPLVDALQKIEGVSVKQGIYRLDFSSYIRRKPAIVASLYALEINTIKVLDKSLYLRGSADLRSLNLLNELYKFLPEERKDQPSKELKVVDSKQAEVEADILIDKILAGKFKDEH